MQELQPDQAKFLLNAVYLPSLKNEHRTTTAVLKAIPVDKPDYKPNDVAMSALELAWHIATSEMMFLNAVATGTFDFSGNRRPDSIRNSADVVDWYGKNFERGFETLTKLSNEQLTKIVDFRGIVQLSAVMYLSFLLNHSIHHRGQLSTYLRPMGAKVPPIYGESYDSKQAREASLQPA
jgi:uncharacterized damage-inducible protein DinB